MENEKHHIDKLLKENLQDYKISHGPEDVLKMADSLKKINFMKFGLSHFNIYLIGIVSVIITGGIIITTNINTKHNDETITNKTNPALVNEAENETNHVMPASENTDKAPDSEAISSDKASKNMFKTKQKEETEPEDINTNETIEEQPVDTIIKYVRDTVYTVKRVIVHDTVKKVIKKPVPKKQ